MAVSTAEPRQSRIEIDEEFNRVYVSEFVVKSDTVYEAPANVVNATGVPAYRTPYQWPPPPGTPLFTDNWAFAGRAVASLLDPADRLHWLVTVRHASLTGGNSSRPNSTQPGDPLSEPARYSGNFAIFDKLTAVDRNGNVMQTTAEEIFDAWRTEDHRDTLIVEVNTADISLDLRRRYVGSVNDFAFWGFAANAVKLADWQFSVQYYGPSDTPYVVNRLQFEFDPIDLWQAQRPNVGTQIIFDDTKQDPEERYLKFLNNRFEIAADGKSTVTPPNTPVAVRVYDILNENPFANLPVPSTLPNPPFLPVT